MSAIHFVQIISRIKRRVMKILLACQESRLMRRSTLLMLAIFLVVALLPDRNATAADQRQEANTLLVKIVAETVNVMRENGYDMPGYVVRNGASDVPLSGPPEKHAFFAYVETGWIEREPTIILHFYEADQIPISARMRLIPHLIALHEADKHRFGLLMRMTKKKYKKPQIIQPKAFFEMKLNRVNP
jgi:hypothetical protein